MVERISVCKQYPLYFDKVYLIRNNLYQMYSIPVPVWKIIFLFETIQFGQTCSIHDLAKTHFVSGVLCTLSQWGTWRVEIVLDYLDHLASSVCLRLQTSNSQKQCKEHIFHQRQVKRILDLMLTRCWLFGSNPEIKANWRCGGCQSQIDSSLALQKKWKGRIYQCERETVYNVLFVQFVFLPTEQAETDFKKIKICNTVYLHGNVCVLNSVR